MSDLSNDRLVVLDEPTMSWAFLGSSSTFADYPRPPARSSNSHADALGVVIHRRQWGLVVAHDQLKHVGDALAETTGLAAPDVARYVAAIAKLAAVGRGGIVPAASEPLDGRFPPHVARAAAAASWADVDALVLTDVDDALRHKVAVTMDGEPRWVCGPRGFSDPAPFLS